MMHDNRKSAAAEPLLKVDNLVVEYSAGDKLYLPVFRLNQIQKYSGGGDTQPKLDRLQTLVRCPKSSQNVSGRSRPEIAAANSFG